jgi:hypothetical protein
MVDYSKSKIYRVIGGNLIYFGSTTQSLTKRKAIHINDKKRGKNLSINPILDFEDYKIELVEEFPCNNKEELLQRERWWIDNNICINIKKPIVSVEEAKLSKKLYQQNHKEMSAISNKKWEEKNKEKRKEYLKDWYLKKKKNQSFLI